MAQELKPIDNSFFGGRRSWRDEARLRLQQALGETGERLGEGLLGESEEEKYLEFLQRTYGSELPRDEEGNIDVPLSRPMGDALRNMSDIGAADKILMMLSGSGSVIPKAASIAAGTETAALLGDAQGEFRKDNPLGGGIMAAAAGLPFGINRLLKEGSRNRYLEHTQTKEGIDEYLRSTKNTPLLPDPSRRQFLKGLGAGIGTLAVVSSPLGALLRNTGKVMEKINPTKFLRKQKPMYDAIAGDKELISTTNFAKYIPKEHLPQKGFNPKVTQTGKNEYRVTIKKQPVDSDYEDIYKAQNKIQLDFFEENGFTKKDLLNIEDDGAVYMLREKGITSHSKFQPENADPGTIKRYSIYENNDATGDYIETFKMDGVPVVSYGNSSSFGHYSLYTVPKEEALLRNAQ